MRERGEPDRNQGEDLAQKVEEESGKNAAAEAAPEVQVSERQRPVTGTLRESQTSFQLPAYPSLVPGSVNSFMH